MSKREQRGEAHALGAHHERLEPTGGRFSPVARPQVHELLQRARGHHARRPRAGHQLAERGRLAAGG